MPLPVKKTAAAAATVGCGLALSITDLGRAAPGVRAALLKGKIHPDPVRPDPARPLEAAVELTCALATAAAAADVLRDHDRAAGERPTRTWVRTPRGTWVQVPAHVMLSVIAGGRPVPNPEVFRPEVRATDLVAPPRRVVRM